MNTPQSKAFRVHSAWKVLAAVAFLTNAIFAESRGNTAINPGATVDGLRMEARALLVNDKEGKLLVIHACLVNESSHDLTVLTKGLGPSRSWDAHGLAVGFDYTGKMKYKGRLMIPSLYPNEPVTLRPGEATMLSAQFPATSLKGGQKIRVGYLVSDEWGKRFDLWHGYVCAVVSVEGMQSK